jgi:hypothetical protein
MAFGNVIAPFDVIFVQMREQHFVDVFRPVARGAQIRNQLAAAVAIQHAGTRIDEHEFRTGVDEERIDRTLHGRLQEFAVEIARDIRFRNPLNDGIDRKRMRSVGKRRHFEIAHRHPVEAGRLDAGLRRGGQGIDGRTRGDAQTRQQQRSAQPCCTQHLKTDHRYSLTRFDMRRSIASPSNRGR